MGVLVAGCAWAQAPSPNVQTLTCAEWNVPMVYSTEWGEPDDPGYNRAPAVFGEPRSIPAMQVQLLEADSDKKIDSDAVVFVYSWRWMQPPTPGHPHGAWKETADKVSCRLPYSGTVEAGTHEVRPRGWFAGDSVKKPEFVGVALWVTTDQGLTTVAFKPEDLRRFQDSKMVVRVAPGTKSKVNWQARDRVD